MLSLQFDLSDRLRSLEEFGVKGRQQREELKLRTSLAIRDFGSEFRIRMSCIIDSRNFDEHSYLLNLVDLYAKIAEKRMSLTWLDPLVYYTKLYWSLGL